MNETAPHAEFPVERIHAAHRRTMLIMGGIASSLFMYMIVVEILHRTQPEAVPINASTAVRMAFFAVAIVAIFLSTTLRSIMLRTAPPAPEARLARVQSVSILALALSELPVVLGLVMYFISRRRADFYTLLVLSAYMLVRHYPQRGMWETFVRRGSDAR